MRRASQRDASWRAMHALCYTPLPMKFLKRLAPFAVIAVATLLLLYLPDRGPERYEDLSDFFRTERTRQAYCGYVVGVVKDGAVFYVDAFGVDGKGGELATDTPLCIGSLSKSMTGFVALALVRDGLLDLDAPVRAYIPWFSFAPGGAGGEGAAVRVRDLLAHSSGVSDRDFDDAHHAAPDLESAVRSLGLAVPRAEPGRRFAYINTGYQTLGLVLEKAAGKPYADIVAERLLVPLGMRRSSAEPAKVAGALPTGAGTFLGAPLPRRQAMPVFGAPSGYIVSTAEDMAKYLAFLAAPAGKKKPPLSPKAVPALFEPLGAASTYAYGWWSQGEGPERRVTHGGSLEAFSASAALWPEKRTGIVIIATQNSLLQSIIAMPALVEGAQRILFEGSAPRPFPLGRLYILLAVAAAVHLLALALQTGGALAWAREVRGRAEAQGSSMPLRFARIRVCVGIALRIAIAVATPFALSALFDRRIGWPLAFQLEPGLAGWLVAALGFGILRNLTRLAWLSRR